MSLIKCEVCNLQFISVLNEDGNAKLQQTQNSEPNPKKLVDVGLGIYPSLQPGELVMFDCIIQKGRLFAINVTGDRGKILRGNQVSAPYLSLQSGLIFN